MLRVLFTRATLVAIVALLTTLPRTGRADVCAGDCDGDQQVTVNELITLVNIDLGSADNSACPDGIVPPDSSVDITMIIKAVNNALTACPAGGPTPTPTPGGGNQLCGNGQVEPPETCDDGGTCIGGDNAGTACTAETDCHGNGICEGGTKVYFACANNDAISEIANV